MQKQLWLHRAVRVAVVSAAAALAVGAGAFASAAEDTPTAVDFEAIDKIPIKVDGVYQTTGTDAAAAVLNLRANNLGGFSETINAEGTYTADDYGTIKFYSLGALNKTTQEPVAKWVIVPADTATKRNRLTAATFKTNVLGKVLAAGGQLEFITVNAAGIPHYYQLPLIKGAQAAAPTAVASYNANLEYPTLDFYNKPKGVAAAAFTDADAKKLEVGSYRLSAANAVYENYAEPEGSDLVRNFRDLENSTFLTDGVVAAAAAVEDSAAVPEHVLGTGTDEFYNWDDVPTSKLRVIAGAKAGYVTGVNKSGAEVTKAVPQRLYSVRFKATVTVTGTLWEGTYPPSSVFTVTAPSKAVTIKPALRAAAPVIAAKTLDTIYTNATESLAASVFSGKVLKVGNLDEPMETGTAANVVKVLDTAEQGNVTLTSGKYYVFPVFSKSSVAKNKLVDFSGVVGTSTVVGIATNGTPTSPTSAYGVLPLRASRVDTTKVFSTTEIAAFADGNTLASKFQSPAASESVKAVQFRLASGTSWAATLSAGAKNTEYTAFVRYAPTAEAAAGAKTASFTFKSDANKKIVVSSIESGDLADCKAKMATITSIQATGGGSNIDADVSAIVAALTSAVNDGDYTCSSTGNTFVSNSDAVVRTNNKTITLKVSKGTDSVEKVFNTTSVFVDATTITCTPATT